MGVQKIISGGQTGADQGALDAAIEAGLAHGGWIPKGRKTEAGPLPEKYRLKEMRTASFPKAAEKNILDAHGALVITRGKLKGGSELTRQLAKTHGFPCLHIDLSEGLPAEAARKAKTWVDQNKIRVLNVAGPQESKAPGIRDITFEIVSKIIKD
jgi:hypothetical protein